MSLIDRRFWANGPSPGALYNFPGPIEQRCDIVADPIRHTLQPMVTGTSVLGLKFNGGVLVACDTLGSYGSLARYRQISRLLKVNDSTVMGVGGDYADFQFVKSIIEQKVINDACLNDGFKYTPKALFTWLTRVYYNRRSKFNPLWNTIVIGGLEHNEPFLGYVDKLGMAYEASSVASGYGAYIAQPLLRDAMEKKPLMNEDEARAVIDHCMTVLYYRDARSWNKYEVACARADGTTKVDGPLEVKTEWGISRMAGGYE